MEESIMREAAEHEPYPLQFSHVEGGAYEFASDELGPGRVERAGSWGQQLEEQYEEEQTIAASPPKMLLPPFPMEPTSMPLKNNPPEAGNEQAGQAGQEQQPAAGKVAPVVPEGQGAVVSE